MWPFPAPAPPSTPPWSTPLDRAPLLAVDVETTGLDPDTDHLVSIGWVPVTGATIQLAGAGYAVIKGAPGFSVGSSATIHHLTDDVVAAGISADEALTRLHDALTGRMMLAHYAVLEQGFLAKLHRDVRGERIRFPVVDTFEIERRHMERMATYPRGEDLRLPRVRERYGLPAYTNHNALSDALACAELYLAQQTVINARRLKDLRY